VDAVLYDPDAKLHFVAPTLARNRLAGFPRTLQAGRLPVHDASLLGGVLESLFGAEAIALEAVAGSG
jgi:hypothetical protein